MTLAAFSAQFGWIDWLVVIGYLTFTTWLGARMAGRQATIRDFFLGGRTLPWWAVSGSIVATEISALTFVSVPWVVFQDGGNWTYLQLGVFGSFLARILVGYILVPVYYKREIYSPYDYMHNQLGGHVRSMTTALFVLGGMLAQSARIYLTAEVVNVVLHDHLVTLARVTGFDELAWAIIIITGVSVAWTLIGGMTTVIWTDVVLFVAFVLGAFIALGAVVARLDGGWTELFQVGWAAKDSGAWGKFTFIDPSIAPWRTFTIWTAVIASTWGDCGAYGTDQLMAQRMFCCRSPREARWAIISSQVSQVVTITVALVGVGLYAYYQKHPLQGEAAELFQKNGDRILPIFTVEAVPSPLSGLIIAAIFAAAISSVMGILTALAQTVMSAFYNPLREQWLRARGIHVKLDANPEELERGAAASAEDRRSVLVSRLLVIGWGMVLGVLAYVAQYVGAKHPSVLNLGLAMAGYCGGALLAGFALAFLPLKVDGRGYLWAAPLSVLYVFAVSWHRAWERPWYGDWTFITTCAVGLLLIGTWLAFGARGRRLPAARPVAPFALQTFILLLGIAGAVILNLYGHFGRVGADKFGNPLFQNLAFPWYVPLGSVVALVWGYLLADRKTPEPRGFAVLDETAAGARA